MICKLCFQKKKLIKAHIIPASFFAKAGANRLISADRNSFPARRPIGEYDNTILCGDCEKKFEEVDDYAFELLVEKCAVTSITHDTITEFDYEKLKLFFISVLWRASVSNQDFYSNVHLGQYENRARKLILNKDPGEPDEFASVLSKYNEYYAKQIIFQPILERWYDVKYYRFFLGVVTVHIKVDKRKSPRHMDRLKLQPSQPLLIALNDINESKLRCESVVPAFSNPINNK